MESSHNEEGISPSEEDDHPSYIELEVEEDGIRLCAVIYSHSYNLSSTQLSNEKD